MMNSLKDYWRRRNSLVHFGNNLIGVLKTYYSGLKIKNKLFLSHIFVVLIICLISLIIIQITFNMYEGILHNEAAKVLNLSTVIIEKELKDVEKFSAVIISTRDVQEQLLKLKTKLPFYERSQIEYDLTASLWTYVFEQNISSVNLIDAQGNQYSGGTPIPAGILGPMITKAARKKGAMLLMEPILKEPSLICARQVRAISNLSLEPLGTLIIRVNIEQLVRRYTTGLGAYGDNLAILSGKKIVFASNDLSKGARSLLGFHNDNGYLVRKIKGKSYFVVYTKSSFSGWIYVNVLPYEIIFKKIILMRNVVLILFILIFLFTIWISIKLARSLTRPIEILTSKIKRVENGAFELEAASAFEKNPPEISPDPPRADEIGDLQRDFDIMIQKINVLIKENYTKQLIIKDTQYKALQAQINPHFLYNTLESINWLAKMNHQPEISQMVESLGNLLRNAISNKEQLITLKEEIELLLNYITIQRIRFGERLDFRLEIDEQWQNLYIPKLSLQPLVENSINYGLEKIPGVCRIIVKSIDLDDDLYIVIEDNGPGIDPLVLEKLNHGDIQPKGLGIGLKNINDRLKLIFGENFGINITGKEGPGARIMVRIPKTGDENVQSFTGR